MRLELRAPAKVNLSLVIGPRRPDGYHELFSVFVPIDLFDSLEFDLEATPPGQDAGTLQIDCETASGEANLAARALRRLEAATGWSLAGRVRIAKGIPVGAGLGGGSSDAAAALRAGAQAIGAAGGRPPEEDQLRELAGEVGADVPFFLRTEAALAKGVGDVLEPLPLPRLALVLLLHEEELSTAWVYGEFDRVGRDAPQPLLERPSRRDARSPRVDEPVGWGFEKRVAPLERRWRGLSAGWSGQGLTHDEAVAGVADLLQNDLEKASFGLLPSLRDEKDALLAAGVLGAVMSGSGPTLVGVCSSAEAAERTAARLRQRGLQAHATVGGGEGALP